MSDPDQADLDQIFTALSDRTRRAIVAQLAVGEAALSAVAEPFNMSQTAVSKHVHILCDAGLVEIDKRGRTRYCRLRAAPMKDAADWLATYQVYWQNQLEALGAYLREEPS